MDLTEVHRVVHQDGPDSRLVQRGDGTYWYQEIYRDNEGRKSWRVRPISEDEVYRSLPHEEPLLRRVMRDDRASRWRRLLSRIVK